MEVDMCKHLDDTLQAIMKNRVRIFLTLDQGEIKPTSITHVTVCMTCDECQQHLAANAFGPNHA